MIIIHNYSPRYTQKLLELGMAQKGDGFKITQACDSKPEMRFNVVAQEGGELHQIVKNYASCFYIDRLQGGVYFSHYDFSEDLQALYDQLTGGHYLGVQLHELGETRCYDWHRITTEMAKTGLPWNEKNIYESVRAISHNKEFPHFSQGSAGEYAAKQPPETLSAFMEDVDSVIRSRMERFHGKIVNCDSCVLYPALERERQMPLSLVEIGGLTANTNYQIATRRGMSRAMGKPWGVYLEPWGIDGGVTAYCFMENGENEWNENLESFEYETKGEKGGTSMSFARRMMYYSLFAGAQYFSEEWGQANTFYNFEDFTLSPYGEIKKTFFELSRRFQNVKPAAPIAAVVPHEYKVLNAQFPYPYKNDVYGEEYYRIVRSMKPLFSDDVKFGFEDIYFTTGPASSLFDVIYDNSYEGAPPYELAVDFSHRLSGGNVIDAYTCENWQDRIREWVNAWLPVEIRCDGSYDVQLFENDGEKFFCVYNHNGITKNTQTGEVANHQADVSMTVKHKDGRMLEVINPCGCVCNLQADDTELCVELTAGNFILCRYA